MVKTRKPSKTTPPDIYLYRDADESTSQFDRATLISELQRSSAMFQRMIDLYTQLQSHSTNPNGTHWQPAIVPPQFADMVHSMSASKYYGSTQNKATVWLVMHLGSNVVKRVKAGMGRPIISPRACHEYQSVAWYGINSDLKQLNALLKKNARTMAALAKAGNDSQPMYGIILPANYSPNPEAHGEGDSTVTVVSNVSWIKCDKCCTVFRTETSMTAHRDGLKCLSNTYKKGVPDDHVRIYNVAVASAVSRGELPGVTVMTKPQMYAPEHIHDVQAMYYKLKPAGIGLVEFIKAAIGKQDA